MTLTPEDFRQEASRLAQLPKADQEAVVAVYRHLAGNSLATPACRLHAKAKAAALEKLLGLRAAGKPARARGQGKARKPSPRPKRKR